jgi:hypothetical protein
MIGGVGFGNVNVEAIQFPGQKNPRPRLVGFALEPSGLDESLVELRSHLINLARRRHPRHRRDDGAEATDVICDPACGTCRFLVASRRCWLPSSQ